MHENSLHPDRSKSGLRKFGLKLGMFLLVSGAVTLHKHWMLYGYWITFWVACLLPLLIFPASLQWVRKALQKLSHWAGTAVTVFILTFVYFLVLVPMGFAAKVFGKEFLALKRNPGAASYWITRQNSASGKLAKERQY
jgi:hypothetical protein